MDELLPNPEGCTKFVPNPFKKEKCKDCALPWEQHKGAISEAEVKLFLEARQKVVDAKAKAEADAKAKARAKKEAKRKSEAAVEDEWLMGEVADDKGEDSDASDGKGFQMFAASDFQEQAAAQPAKPKELKVRNLIDFSECDVAEDIPSAKEQVPTPVEATAAAARRMTVPARLPVEAISSEENVMLSKPAVSSSSIAAPPVRQGPDVEELEIEVQDLRQMLAQANEVKAIELDIIKDEVEELRKQLRSAELRAAEVDELRKQLSDAQLRAAEVDELRKQLSAAELREAELSASRTSLATADQLSALVEEAKPAAPPSVVEEAKQSEDAEERALAADGRVARAEAENKALKSENDSLMEELAAARAASERKAEVLEDAASGSQALAKMQEELQGLQESLRGYQEREKKAEEEIEKLRCAAATATVAPEGREASAPLPAAGPSVPCHTPNPAPAAGPPPPPPPGPPPAVAEASMLREQVASLQMELQDLQQSAAAAQADRDKAFTEVASLRLQLQSGEEGAAAYMTQARGLATEVSRLQELLNNQAANSEAAMQEAAQERMQEVARLQHEGAGLLSSLQEKDAELSKAISERDEAKTLVQCREVELRTACAARDQAQAAMQGYEAELPKLAAERDEAVASSAAAAEALEAASKKDEVASARLEELQEKERAMVERETAVADREKRSSGVVTQLTMALDEATSEADRLKAEKDALASEIGDLRRGRSEQQESVEEADGTNTALTSALEELRAAKSAKLAAESQVEQFQQALAARQATELQSAEALQQAKADLEVLKQAKVAADSEVVEWRRRATSDVDSTTGAHRLDSDGSDRVAKLTDELDSQSRELASLREAKTAVESQVQTLERKLTAAEQEAGTAMGTVATLTASLEDVMRDSDALKAARDSLVAEVSSLKTVLCPEKAEEAPNAEVIALQALQKVAEELRADLAARDAELDTLRSKPSPPASAAPAALQNNAEQERLQAALQAERKATEAARREAQEAKQQFQDATTRAQRLEAQLSKARLGDSSDQQVAKLVGRASSASAANTAQTFVGSGGVAGLIAASLQDVEMGTSTGVTLSDLGLSDVALIPEADRYLQLLTAVMAVRADARLTVFGMWLLCHTIYVLYLFYEHLLRR
mmetsp:Transcript_37454/g.86400  ORF Transcript_37454/g.86400 Transcript_37454/m.86400 type:complete len:1136 (-) Transcript_37454:40-3447(-)